MTSIPGRGEIVESENPLDVLSRAATMVEKSEISPRLSPPIVEKTKTSCERSPSFKERHPKFRKSSTPDYMVALDAARSLKRQNSLQSELSTSDSRMDTSSPNNNSSVVSEDNVMPLDMSIKKRSSTPPPPPPPPQYRFNPLRQHSPPPPPIVSSVINPSPPHFSSRPPVYKSPPPYPATPSPPSCNLPPPPSYEESTVKCTYPTKNTPPPPILQEVEQKTKIKEITIITNSSADPLLDEHFRRSLGADYESLFKKKSSSNSDSESSSTESTPPKVPQMPREDKESSKDQTTTKTNNGDKNNKHVEATEDLTQVADPVKAFQEDMEMEGYTVEDHFAKALGDTWIQLQKAEEEKRNKKSEESTTTTKPAVMASS